MGGVYAANTIGAIFGSLGFSIMIIPLMGTQQAQRVLMGLSALSGLLMLVPLLLPSSAKSTADKGPGTFKFAGVTTLMAALLATVLLAVGVSKAPWGIIAYGRFMATYGDQLVPGIINEENVPLGGGRSIYCVYAAEGLK